jgi:hypothetical protein
LPDSPNEVQVTLLLCDAAQSVGGKLYILGGGWTQAMPAPGAAITMALAIRVSIPWDMANQRIQVDTRLLTADGEEVDVGAGPVLAQTGVEVGRPPGLERGTPLDAMLAVNAGALPLQPGRYVWHVEVDGEIKGRAPFQILG